MRKNIDFLTHLQEKLPLTVFYFLQFDNGSPVVWQTSVDRRILGVGITSIGSGCGKDQPAINTRIGAYIDWIESETPKGNFHLRIFQENL